MVHGHATPYGILVAKNLARMHFADDDFLIAQHGNLLARQRRTDTPEVEVLSLRHIITVCSRAFASVGQGKGHASAHSDTAKKGIVLHLLHTGQGSAREERIVHFGGDASENKRPLLRTILHGNTIIVLSIAEFSHIGALIIRFFSNGRRSHVFEHKVRSRKCYNAHSKGKNTNRILQLIFQQIAEGDF